LEPAGLDLFKSSKARYSVEECLPSYRKRIKQKPRFWLVVSNGDLGSGEVTVFGMVCSNFALESHHTKTNNFTLQFVNLLTALLNFLSFTTTSFAQSGWGGWTNSCTEASLIGNSVLCAKCYNDNGDLHATKLDLNSCITNFDSLLAVSSFILLLYKVNPKRLIYLPFWVQCME
jgi:CVNH domain